jgi:hypothetical protein
MASTDIDKPSDYFVSNLHTGNGGTLNITSLDFQPDLVWVKERNNAKDHAWYDSVRGANQLLESNKTGADSTTSAGISSFNSDGWTTGNFFQTNDNGDSYVSWNWKAGTSFTNDASATGIGSIDSAGSVNNDSGFSIVSYTGTGSAGTIKHGLSTALSMIIVKKRNASNNWDCFHASLGATKHIYLNATNAVMDNVNRWNDTAPTTSVFSVGDGGSVNASSDTYIAYCFAEKQGYSKFGSYTGNGSTDGVFCFTGMKVGWLMIKRTDSANSWIIMDNKRNTFNPMGEELKAEVSDAGNDATRWDQLSNGFKLRNGSGAVNASGGTYIYMALAENPFVTSSGVPACAR